jgi:hypothetical protein
MLEEKGVFKLGISMIREAYPFPAGKNLLDSA